MPCNCLHVGERLPQTPEDLPLPRGAGARQYRAEATQGRWVPSVLGRAPRPACKTPASKAEQGPEWGRSRGHLLESPGPSYLLPQALGLTLLLLPGRWPRVTPLVRFQALELGSVVGGEAAVSPPPAVSCGPEPPVPPLDGGMETLSLAGCVSVGLLILWTVDTGHSPASPLEQGSCVGTRCL